MRQWSTAKRRVSTAAHGFVAITVTTLASTRRRLRLYGRMLRSVFGM